MLNKAAIIQLNFNCLKYFKSSNIVQCYYYL